MNIRKTKYLITTLQCSAIIFTILFSIIPGASILFDTLVMGSFIFSSIMILIIFFFFTRKSKLQFKAIGAILMLSGLFFAIGEILSYWQVKQLNLIPITVSPFMYILGAIIGIIPLKSDPERFSNVSWYWDTIAIVNVAVVILLEISFILLGFPLMYVMLGIPLIFLIFILQGFIIRDIRSKKIESSFSTDLDEDLNVLEMFTRPQKVTEEEVSVSKEKKICLICKGKLSRNIYICPKCSSFYCQKCSETMSDLENACWVCETPFDESKPVRLPEMKDEKIIIEEEHNHKTN
ncbi:MAG: membrane protein of unknown function [Promethearchaeota archaeon]|nr:MAG: membrane protein of unknown function [Candidatus Lokiarchaeota archaeon]